jgi:hypothetical protein
MARVTDVTAELLHDTHGPGDYVKRVHTAKPARALSPTLAAFYEKWRASGDKTVGRVSNALAYAKPITGSRPSYHTNMIRLIKGGHIHVCQVEAKAPEGSAARRDDPWQSQNRFLLLQPNACPAEVDPAATPFMGARRRRR